MSTSPSLERRQAPRVASALPVSLEWRSGQGEIRRVRGTTRDVGRRGLYCFLEEPLPISLPVAFDVVFPGELTADVPLKLRCQGRILRSETLGRRFGVAASIETHQVVETLERRPESDRRANERIVPDSAIVVEYPGLRSVIRDLSLTGAFIEDERPLPVGRVFDLRLRADGLGKEILVKAIVRRVESYAGMAVEFVALNQEAHNHLQEIVQKGGVTLA